MHDAKIFVDTLVGNCADLRESAVPKIKGGKNEEETNKSIGVCDSNPYGAVTIFRVQNGCICGIRDECDVPLLQDG